MKMKLISKASPASFKIILLLVFLTALIASIIILSSVPPVSRDALSHHLAVPKLYLKHGGIYEIPHVVFSYYPMNMELLYLVPLYFGNDIATKYIHFSFALLTAWLIFNYLYKRIDLFYALLGAIFFLSLPIIIKLSITVYVDLGLVFFSTAAIIYFLKWIENRFQLKHLIMAACWCGLALGTKYNGLLIWFLLTLFVPYFYTRKTNGTFSSQGKALGYGVIFMAVALFIFSPWMIRNYHWKKNPIYPLYHSWFAHQKLPVSADMPAGDDKDTAGKYKAGLPKSQNRIGLFAYRQIIYNESWQEIILVPIRIFFSGKDGDPRYFDGKLNPFLLILPLFAFVRLPKDRPQFETEKRIWLGFSLLYLLITFFKIEMRIRYIAPIVPPLIILSMMGLYRLENLIQARFPTGALKIPKVLSTSVVGMMLLLNVVYIRQQFGEVQPIDYLSGRVGRDEYIEKYRKEYPVIRYANANLSANAKILSIFLGNRIYHSDQTMISDPNVFLKAVRSSDSPQQISMDLRKRGLTHVIIRTDLFAGWLENNFDEKKKELVKLFFKEKMQLTYLKNGYALFEIEN